MTDMPGSGTKAREQMLQLMSELMEARMKSFEALLQLQSTMKAIRELHAGPWPGGHADMLDDSISGPMMTAVLDSAPRH